MVSIIIEIVKGFFQVLPTVLKSHKEKGKTKKVDLREHGLFTMLEIDLMNVENTDFINDYKTVCGRDMIRRKLYSGSVQFMKVAEAIEANPNMNPVCAMKVLGRAIIDTVNEYERQWKEDGVHEKVLKEVSKYHRRNIKWLSRLIKIEFVVHIKHKTVKAAMGTCFDHIISAYKFFLADIQIYLNGLNGEAMGHIYKGIENCGTHITYGAKETGYSDGTNMDIEE